MTFYGSATGIGSRLQRRISQQAEVDLDPFVTMRDFASNGGPFAFPFDRVEPGKVSAGGAPLPYLPVKGGGVSVDMPFGNVDPNCYGQLHALANFFGYYDITPNDSDPEYYDWRFDLLQSTAADPYLKLHDDNDFYRRTMLNNRIGQIVITIGDSGRVDFTSTFHNPKEWHFWADPTQTVGSGNTRPTVRGPAGEVLTTESLDHLVVEATTVSAGVVTLKTYDEGESAGVSQAYTIGNRAVRLKDHLGVDFGSEARPYLGAWGTGASVVTGNIWTVERRRDRWSQSLPTQYLIPAVNFRLYYDGAEIPIEGGITITGTWEVSEPRVDIFREYGGYVKRAGKMMWTVELSREIRDLVFQAGLHNRTKVALVLEGRTDSEITTGVPAVFRAVFPQLGASGEMFDVDEGALNTEESVTLHAEVPDTSYTDPVEGDSWSSHAGFLLRNAAASL
jgi:hypothetical protein